MKRTFAFLIGTVARASSNLAQDLTSDSSSATTGASPVAQTTNWSVVARGPHQRSWQRVTYSTNAANRVTARTESYVRICSEPQV